MEKVDKTEKKGWLSIVFSYTEGRRGKLALSVLLSVVSIVAGILPYFFLYRVIEAFVNGTVTESVIAYWCLAALVFYAVKILCFGWSTGLAHSVAYHILEQLRLRVADRFLHAPLGEVQAHSIGEIKAVMVDKIENMEPALAHMIPEGAGHLVLPVVSLAALAVLDWRVALASLVTLPLAMVCMVLTFVISGKSFEIYNASNERMNSAIVEYIEGIEIIKTFGRAGVSYEKYAKAITDFRMFVVKWLSSTWVTMKLAFALFPSTLLGTLPVSLYLADRGSITGAQAALAVMLSMSMVGSLAKLEVFSENTRQMKMTVEQLNAYLTMTGLPEPECETAIKHHDVELKNVHFSYSGEKKDEVLHGIDLTLPEGSYTALVGPSGGGKSTVAKLIARFWNVTEGTICIGGVDIRRIPVEQLAEHVSFVTQDNFLFRCSILENIRLGNPAASDEEVKAAARAAQCEEFILKLPQGYDTPAGEAGKRLSGGEKQRIALARAFLKDSNLYILDESTSNLDFATENLIFNMIYDQLADRSMLIVAHRLSTVRDCDMILVMDHGQIVERGTHDELLAKQGKYYELWNLQQGIFRRKKEEPKPVAHAAVVEEDDDGDEAITY